MSETATMNRSVQKIADALRVLIEPGSVFEIRALGCRTSDNKRPHQRGGFFDFDHIDDAAEVAFALSQSNGGNAQGVYFTLNPLKAELLARRMNRVDVMGRGEAANDSDVIARRWLFIDCDPKRVDGVSATDAEKLAAQSTASAIKAELSSAEWPDPIFADSGNGAHLLYRIDLPPKDDDLVRNCLRALAAKYDSDAVTVDQKVFNPARICKLYGTVSRKGDSTRDRPHRFAVMKQPDTLPDVASAELLERLAATAPAEAVTAAQQPASGSILDRAAKYIATIPGAESGQRGHDAAYRVACNLVRGYGLSKAEARSLFDEWNRTCKPEWTDGEINHKLDEAEEKAEGDPRYILTGKGAPSWYRPARIKPDYSANEFDPLPIGEEDVPFEVPAGVSTEGEAGAIADEAVPADTEESVSPYKPIQPYPVLSVIHPEGQTELANSQRLVNQFGRNLRFVKKWSRWVVWDGMRWRLDCEKNTEAMKFAKSLAASLWTKKALSDEDAVKYCKKMASHAGCRSTLNLAASDLAIEHGDMDQNAWLLNVKNGTIDLRSGSLRQHERRDLLTKLCHSTFDPSATCPRFDQFLRETFPDPDLQSFIQRLFGYGLTADVSEHVLPIFWGAGSNGKSTLIEIIQSVVGAGYATSAADELLLAGKSSRHPTEVADLYGMRLVFASETDDGRRLNEGLVKRLTGGDEISARRMREDFWKFRPTHKLFLATNHKPQVRGTDQGIWRRLLLVPFVERFEGSRKIKNLAKKIVKEERSGILAWAVRGCLDWQTAGLNPPEAVLNSTAEYRREEDVISEFIHDCCLTGYSMYKVKFSDLYDEFAKWGSARDAESRSELPTRKAVGSWLKENGYKKIESGGVFYSGIGLKSIL